MTAPTPTLATAGDLAFSYELQVEIDMDFASDAPTGTPEWVQLAFVTDVKPTNAKNFVDSSTYYNKGAKAQAVTGEDWGLTLTHQIQRNSDGTYIETLQALFDAAAFGTRNDGAKAHVRFYDTEGADYAFEGKAYVSMERGATGNNDVATQAFTFTGDGALTKIANPYIAVEG